MKEQWFIRNKQGNFDLIAKQCNISPIMAKLLVNRGINSQKMLLDYLHTDLNDMYKPEQLKDMILAGDILQQNISDQKRIRVIGDYDVDGVMATYILVCGLRQCGAMVDFQIPDRIKDGYGINIEILKKAKEDKIDTIITCDNGIAALEEIAYGKDLDLTIIITDHHSIVYEEVNNNRVEYLPKADAVINPKRSDCTYPYKEICGAFVAYKVVEYLFQCYEKKKEEVYSFLEFAAIATVCDVMDLVDENRILVKNGLEYLKQTNNIGMKALLEVNGLIDKEINVYHLGYIIGPCINASGRLESAKLGLDLLLSTQEDAQSLAWKLKELNDERKDMTNRGEKLANEMLEKEKFHQDSVLVLYLNECHESLAGIIAGRIKEKYQKPTLVLTKTNQGVKGSGRSIEAYHMFEKLSECKSLFTKFGGHKMAAGFSLEEEKIPQLRKQLNENAGLKEEDFIKKIVFDDVLELDKITMPLIQEFELLKPYGNGNPQPLFAVKDVSIVNATVIGVNKNVVKLSLKAKNKIYNGILFRNIDNFFAYIQKKYGQDAVESILHGGNIEVSLDFIFYPDLNEYRNQQNIQIVIENYR